MSSYVDSRSGVFPPGTDAARRVGRTTLRVVSLYVALFALAMVPIFAVHTLPLRDFQNHLARMVILAADDRDAIFAQFYRIRWAPTGAFALDLLLPGPVRLIGVEWVGKLFVAAIVFLLAGGTLFLNHTLFRHRSWWPLVALLLLYNWVLTWGFANYLFGLGIMLWIYAAWLRTEHWAWPARTACFAVLSYGLLICHLYAFGLYGLCVVSAELAARWREYGDIRLWRAPRFWLCLAQFVPPLAIFILTSPTAGALRIGAVFWLRPKLYGLATLVNTGMFALDLAICLALYAAFAFAIWRKWLRLDPRLVGVVVVLIAAFPLWPDYVLGGAFAAFRLPVAIAFIAVAGSAPNAAGNRLYRPAMSVIALLLVVQTGFTTARWLGFDREYDLIRQVVDHVPDGKRLLVVIPQNDDYYGLNEPPIVDAPLLNATHRHILANGAFVWPGDNSSLSLTAPYHWLQTDRAWFPEYYPADIAAIRRAPLSSERSPFRARVLAAFDYVMIADEARFGFVPSKNFQRIAGAGDFTLYKLRR